MFTFMRLIKFEIKLSNRTRRDIDEIKAATRDIFTQPWNPVEIGLTIGAALVTAAFFMLPWLTD